MLDPTTANLDWERRNRAISRSRIVAGEPTLILRVSIRLDASSQLSGLWVLARRLPAAPDRLQIRLLGDEQSIINFDAKVAHGAF